MQKQIRRSLRVQAEGRRRYINVPVARAKELHDFLRSNFVRSAPPSPASTGFDSIELAQDSDVQSIQELLDKF